MVRAHVAGAAAHNPETQAGPLMPGPPSGRQLQLEVHWPGGRPPVVPALELLPPLVLPPVPLPLLTSQVPLLQISPVGQGVLVLHRVQKPSVLQLPASHSVSLVQGMGSPESLFPATVGLQDAQKTAAAAAVAKATGINLRMAAFLMRFFSF